MTANDNACCQRRVDPEANKIFVAAQLESASKVRLDRHFFALK